MPIVYFIIKYLIIGSYYVLVALYFLLLTIVAGFAFHLIGYIWADPISYEIAFPIGFLLVSFVFIRKSDLWILDLSKDKNNDLS